MTLRDSLLPALAAMRGIGGRLGLREVRVYLRTVTWSGTLVGQGTRAVADTEITEDGYPPRVRDATGDDALAFGELAVGSVVVGPMTPSHSVTAGIDLDDLEAALSAKQTRHVRLAGGRYRTAGQLYRIAGIERRPLSYRLALSPDA